MPTKKETIQKINDMIGEVTVAMLVTVDSQGMLQSRPMTTQKQEFNGDLWFFASRGSEVVKEIEKHAAVNVAYSEDGNYVSLSGDAAIVTDVQKKKELWNPELTVWFEGKGPEAPEVVLLKVNAKAAQYWDTPNGVIGNAINVVKAVLSGDEESAIDSDKVKF